MKFPVNLRIIVGAATLVASVTLAAPRNAERHGELGFDVRGTDFSSDVTSKTGAGVGLRGGYNFSRLFALEGQAFTAKADSRELDTTMKSVFVNGVFNFHPRPNVTPYVLVGVGQANLEFDLVGIRGDDSAAAYQVAAGSRFWIGSSRRFAARIEASRMREETFGQGSNHTAFNTGLTWKLGRNV